jgi:hypothetical protein
LGEIGILEMTRGTVFGASRKSIGCSSSPEPALVMDLRLELLNRVSLSTMLPGAPVPLTIDWSARNTSTRNTAQ